MLLSDVEIRKLIEEKGYIEDYTDLEVQLQQCGFDLTLDYVEKPMYKIDLHATIIDFDNSQRQLTPMQKVPVEFLDTDETYYNLPPGDYVFHTKEKVRVPSNIGAILRVRSSLHRVGIQFTSSCIDPGYYGHLTGTIHIPAPGLRILHGARFCQILSWYLTSDVDRLYRGTYHEDLENASEEIHNGKKTP